MSTRRAVSNWQHSRPRNYFSTAVKELGKPTFVSNTRHGMAFWKKTSRSLFDEHLLRDEDVKHCVPAPHHDFFYSSIKLYIPPNKLIDVLALSGSINYDGLKSLLTARCGGLGANIATLYLGAKIAMGESSIKEVKRRKLYASHIRGEAMDYPEMLRELRRLKTTNHRKYQSELKKPFYKLAFDSC